MNNKTTNFFSIKNITIVFIIIWMLLFALIPNIAVVITSFLSSSDSNFVEFTPTLEHYSKLIDPIYLKVFINSIYIAGVVTIFTLIIGYAFAYTVTLMPTRYHPFLLVLIILPFWTNSLIRIYGLKNFLANNGVLNKILSSIGLIDSPIKILNTEIAVIIGIIYLLLPFMILPIYSSLEKIDNRMLEAARDLGANTFNRFTRIIVPLSLPGIVAGCSLTFLPSMGMFYVADLLGGSKILLIGNIIKNEFLFTRNWPLGATISIGMIVVLVILPIIYNKINKSINNKKSGDFY